MWLEGDTRPHSQLPVATTAAGPDRDLRVCNDPSTTPWTPSTQPTPLLLSCCPVPRRCNLAFTRCALLRTASCASAGVPAANTPRASAAATGTASQVSRWCVWSGNSACASSSAPDLHAKPAALERAGRTSCWQLAAPPPVVAGQSNCTPSSCMRQSRWPAGVAPSCSPGGSLTVRSECCRGSVSTACPCRPESKMSFWCFVGCDGPNACSPHDGQLLPVAAVPCFMWPSQGSRRRMADAWAFLRPGILLCSAKWCVSCHSGLEYPRSGSWRANGHYVKTKAAVSAVFAAQTGLPCLMNCCL